MPASGAVTIVAPVHTSTFRPASRGELRSTSCRNCDRKKIDPNIPKYMVSDAKLVTANARREKNAIGSIGSRARRSHTTNAASSTAPAPSEARTVGEVHPSDWARTRPNTTPKAPVEASARPGRSSEP